MGEESLFNIFLDLILSYMLIYKGGHDAAIGRPRTDEPSMSLGKLLMSLQ